MERDIIRTIHDNIRHVGHFHTVRTDRNELDETLELYDPPIMKTIAGLDYDGCVGQVISPRNRAAGEVSLEAAYRVCDV